MASYSRGKGGKGLGKGGAQRYYDEDEEDDYEEQDDYYQNAEENTDFLDFEIKEEFATSENKDQVIFSSIIFVFAPSFSPFFSLLMILQVISKCVPESPDFHFYTALKLLADKKAFADDPLDHKDEILAHISAIEESEISLPYHN